MIKKQPLLKPQLITADAPGLPREFAVIETDDVYEAGAMVQEAFEDPVVTLVVWSNAADLVPESLKHSIRAISGLLDVKRRQARTEMVPGFWRAVFSEDGEDFFCGRQMKDHFNRMATITGCRDDILKEWRENCCNITDDFIEAFDAKSLKLATRFQRNGGDHDGLHTDNILRSDSIRGMRIVDGDTTLYYGPKDVERVMRRQGYSRAYFREDVELKENAQAWTVRPWDFSFLSRNVAHQMPSSACGFDAEKRRIVEVYDIRSRHEFVIGAQRPLLKILCGKPALY